MRPVCSFCGERPVVAWFEGPDFTVDVDSPDQVRSEEAWLACHPCVLLIDVEDREGLARRGARRSANVDPQEALMITRERQDDLFWKARDSG